MRLFFKLLVVALAAVKLSFFSSAALAGKPACEFFKTMAPILDVIKDPPKVGDIVAELKRNDVVCVKQKRKIGKRNWGQASHQVLANGTHKIINGWVGLRFMAPFKVTNTTSAPPTLKPSPAKKIDYNRVAEIAYWNTVRTSNDADLIVSYLEQYPSGTFAKLARLLLKKINKKEGADGPDREGKSDKTERRKTSAQRRTTASPPRKRTARTKTKRRDTHQFKRRQKQERLRRKSRKRDRANLKVDKTRRTPKRRRNIKRCRRETEIECIRRGGSSQYGSCDTQQICK
ncbi:MAG: hypothetical protein ACI9XZ_004278 [Alphaproteobacteria bacterium]